MGTPYTTHVALTFNRTGQVLEFYPPTAEIYQDGSPTSAATYTAFAGTESNDGTSQFSGTATLDTVSTTVNAASGFSQTNRKRINLTSTTGVAVGRRYLIQNATAQREIVVVAAISATYVDVEYDLSYSYTTADTFKGLRHSFTIDATFIATESKINVYGGISDLSLGGGDTRTTAPPYRLRWQYATAGGVVRDSWTTFDVARQKYKQQLSIHDIRPLLPDVVWNEWTQQRGQGFEPQIEEAQRMLEFDIRAAGYDPDAIRDQWITNELIKYAFMVIIARAGISVPGRDIELFKADAERNYERMFQKAIGATLKSWIDTGSEGGIADGPAQQLWLGR